jgi:hypothetical protein
MATPDIDPFEIGRRGLAIPFREFPIWLACALWPFAFAVAIAIAQKQAADTPPLVRGPVGWIVDTVFDWCWMTALCRSTVRQFLTFPAARGFWLLIVLKLCLSVLSWVLRALLAVLATAAFAGTIPYIDASGVWIQLAGIVIGPIFVLAAIWIGLRLMIWPAHCVASGRLVGPRTIWQGMQGHSFDGLVMLLITSGPLLLFFTGEFIAARTLDGFPTIDPVWFQGIVVVIGTYTNGAFDAAMLVAYYAIFVPKATAAT